MEASATRMLWSMSVLPTERPLRSEGFELPGTVTGKKNKLGFSLELSVLLGFKTRHVVFYLPIYLLEIPRELVRFRGVSLHCSLADTLDWPNSGHLG